VQVRIEREDIRGDFEDHMIAAVVSFVSGTMDWFGVVSGLPSWIETMVPSVTASTSCSKA
jgi:hypothetical protein